MGDRRSLESNNTMKAVRFLNLQIIYAVIGTLVYLLCPGLYRPVWEGRNIVSAFLFGVFAFVGYMVGMIFSLYNERNGISILRNTVLPLGLYTSLTHYKDGKEAIVAFIIIWGILVFFLVSECRQGNQDVEKADDNLCLREIRVVTWIWNFVGLGLVALMLVFAYDGVMEWLSRLAG